MNLDFDRLSIAPQAEPDDELERFRREWKQDLARKGKAENVPQEAGSVRPPPVTRPASPVKTSPKTSPKATFQSLANKPSNVVDPQQHALQLYTEAVEHEQAGKLNEALILYRKAFKLDGTWCMIKLSQTMSTAHTPARRYLHRPSPLNTPSSV